MKYGILCVLLLQDGLEYVKRGTREESKQASIEASLKKLPPLNVTLSKIVQGARGRVMASPKGDIDPAAEFPGNVRWEDGSKYEDGKPHRLKAAAWVYRRFEVEQECSITVTVESAAGLVLFLNGANEQVIVNTHLLPGNRAEFGVRLRKGTNHFLLSIGGPTPYFLKITPIGPELMSRLEARLDADFPGLSEQTYYRMETLATPAFMEVGGMDMMPDGRLMVCTRRGEVWSLKDGRWKRFASGLHEPLGLVATGADEIVVIQRPELTRIKDSNADGGADVFETISEGFVTSGGSHEFVFGLARDRKGDFYGTMCALGGGTAKYLGWCFKITSKGEFIPVASGFRCPNGVGINDADEVFVTDNQGDWVGTCPLYHVTPGDFFGHPTSLRWDPKFEGRKLTAAQMDQARKRAAVLFPHGLMGQSAAQPVCDTTDGKFGPFAGQLFVGDQSASTVMRVALEKVGGEYQGACFPFRRGFQSGNNRGVFASDGSLYCGQTDRGWGAVGGRPFGIQRLVWTGIVPMEIHSMNLTSEGFDLTFTKPVKRDAARDPSAYSLQHYYYKYHGTYGSPPIDRTPVAVAGVRISDDGRRVSLILPELMPNRVYELHVRGLVADDGAPLLHPDAYYTLNRLKTEERVLHVFTRRTMSPLFTTEGSAIGDINRDGKPDVVIGPCWYEGPDFRNKHELYAPRAYDRMNYADAFHQFVSDLNGDGWNDVLVVGFPGKDSWWLENPGKQDVPWKRHEAVRPVDGEAPAFADVTGDGKPELIFIQGGRIGWARPGDWTFHAITPKSPDYHAYTHGLGVGDVNGDGRMDILERTGWWEQPAGLEGDPEWIRHRAPFGPGGAQMFAVDVDGDGDNDVVTTLDAHRYGLAWFEQIKEDGRIAFTKRLIMGKKPEENRYGVKFSQPHALAMADVDGDGVLDIVTGKRILAHSKGDPETDAPAVLYWFRTVRSKDGVEFVPYLIDDASGVGNQVVCADVNGDSLPDVVVGNKSGSFIFLNERRTVSPEEWTRAQPRPHLSDREY